MGQQAYAWRGVKADRLPAEALGEPAPALGMASLARAVVLSQGRTQWWSGHARVRTFSLEELTATKLRALYQRRKGRDLFDLWATITHLELDDPLAIEALTHYERLNDRRAFTFPQLRQNLAEKLQDQEFLGDVGALVAIPEDAYDPKEAAHLVMTRLGVRLRNAPTGSEGFEGL